MGCRKCDRYSSSLGKCLSGKANPKTIKGGVQVAKLMGLGYICDMDGMQTKVLKKLTT